MADVTNLEFKKYNKLSDIPGTAYSVTKTTGNKICTIFVNDRTSNGFGKDDYFYYDGDISLFSQKEIKDLVDKGVEGKKYNASNVAKDVNPEGTVKLAKMDNCKDVEEGKYYELGSIMDCATKASEGQTFVKAETKAATAAEAAKTAPPAAPAATEKPAEPAKAEKTEPAPPAQALMHAPEHTYDNQEYYDPQQGGYEYESPLSPLAGSALCGGAIGGIIGALIGGFKGFFSGALGGALGGVMSLFGGGIGGFMSGGYCGGGYDDGMASLDAALNWTFAKNLSLMSAPRQYVLPALQSPSEPATPASNLPELTDKNFNETIKNSKTPVVVEFVMDGCEPCKEQGPILEGISKDYSGKVQIYQANINKADTIRNEYKVDKTPTILVFKDGKVVKKLEGLKSKEELATVLNDNSSKATT